ncbi:MAG TPA: HAMP domain-containing sensor histidine kinase [Synergistales bacterium]|nr:HAMP domain-containing sensor histidine kinase [Synergistales bacterium]
MITRGERTIETSGGMSTQALWGTILLAAWGVSHFYERPIYHVFRFLDLSVRYDDSGYLLAATAVLVVINAARALLLYEGWFLVGNGAAEATGHRSVGRVLPLVGIPVCYQAVAVFDFPSIPHFGMPAVLGLASVLLVQYLTRGVTGWINRAVALIPLLVSFQWLDVIPSLTKYGFGWGEISMAIKQIAELPNKTLVLDLVGGTFFLFLFAGALLTIELLVSYERQLEQFRRFRAQERELYSLKEQQLQSRAIREMQNLVHDLRRPLTTIVGLSDVISEEGSENSRRHASVILKASGSMDQMISEILDAASARTVTVSALVDYSLSQVSPMDWSPSIEVDIPHECGKVLLNVNAVRLSRALANLLDNAARASSTSPEGARIRLTARSSQGSIKISVEDNGPGFIQRPKAHRSGWGSTGLGLVFVQEVVRDHGGKVTFGKSPLGGASVTLSLKRVGDRGEDKEEDKEGGSN